MVRGKKDRAKKSLQVRAQRRSGTDSLVVWVKRSFLIVVLLVGIGLVVFGVKSGLDWTVRQLYAENPRFEIQQLIVTCEGKLTEDYIREMSGLREGMNLFEFSLDEVERRLLEVSRIESVHLKRDLPHTLSVRVTERRPVAQIIGRTFVRHPYMVDRFGVVLPHRRSLAGLPIMRGLDVDVRPGMTLDHSDVELAIQIVEECESSQDLSRYVRLERVDMKYSDHIRLHLEGGAEVRIPRFSLPEKLRKLATVIKIAQGQGKHVKEVDLTLDSVKVPVKYY